MAKARKRPSRRGATSQRRSPKTERSSFRLPGWLWALAGIGVGFFLAQHQHGTAPWQEQIDTPEATVLPKPSGSDERSAARQTEGESEPAMPTFEFYTLLPETEVIAPGGALPSTVNRPEASASADSDVATDDVAADDPIAQVIAANTRPDEQAPSATAAQPQAEAAAPLAPSRYMLQAASFKELDDAEQLRSRLRNLSLLAEITEVQASGESWHRVQVGPYEDTRELNRAQDLMATQGIEPLLIQLQN